MDEAEAEEKAMKSAGEGTEVDEATPVETMEETELVGELTALLLDQSDAVEATLVDDMSGEGGASGEPSSRSEPEPPRSIGGGGVGGGISGGRMSCSEEEP